MNTKELADIIEKHHLWLLGAKRGKQAYLRGADLRGADLRSAGLSYVNLRNADLRGSDLSYANLRNADLRGANLIGANLIGASLGSADLSDANLIGANLYDANLIGANLYGANLIGANLYGANLYVAYLERAKINFPIVCPEEGSFIGFKKCKGDLIVKLQITKDSLRCSATSRKCRCSKAKVLSITKIDGTDAGVDKVASKRDEDFIYEIGKTVKVSNFDTNRWNECSAGIHFFITRQEAVDY